MPWRSPAESIARSWPKRRNWLLGDAAVAVTGVSASLAAGELEAAQQIARQIGIRHEVLLTEEFNDPNYTANPANRCYFCKTELYDRMQPLATRLRVAVIVNGANLDDAGDWRPGMQAAGEHRVYSPLLECGFTKDDVRALAAEWQLPVWDKPASPCLSSRVAYGEEVTPQRLQMIDRAEQLLRSLGLRTVRVRYHRGDLARLEVPADAISRLAEPEIRAPISRRVEAIGLQIRNARLGRLPLWQPKCGARSGQSAGNSLSRAI